MSQPVPTQGVVENGSREAQRALRLLWNDREQQTGVLLLHLYAAALQVAQQEKPEEILQPGGLPREGETVSVAETVGMPTCRSDRKSTRLNSSHSSISYAVF